MHAICMRYVCALKVWILIFELKSKSREKNSKCWTDTILLIKIKYNSSYNLFIHKLINSFLSSYCYNTIKWYNMSLKNSYTWYEDQYVTNYMILRISAPGCKQHILFLSKSHDIAQYCVGVQIKSYN